MSENQRNEMKADAMSMGSAMTALELNGLKYRIPQPLSTAVARTFKREYSQRQTYQVGAPIIFDWNTGTSYVEPQSALLSFELELTNNDAANRTYTWGSGLGGCSLIEEIRIISKNGVEIDRTQSANVLAKTLADYKMSPAGRENLQMLDGYPAGVGIVVPAGATVTLPITIPMKFLSGFFRPVVEGMLIPAGLASGLRLELLLAPAARAFQSNGGVDPSYVVANTELLMQLTDLNDPTQSALMRESSASGLEYTFPSYFATSVSNAGSSQITEQIKKAVSQATRVFTVLFDKTDDDPTVITSDGFASMYANRVGAYQYRVGSSYYPMQQIQRSSELWAVAASTFDGLRNIEYQPNQVNYVDFQTGGKLLLGSSLETSDRLNLSGLPLNNSNTLELRFTQKAGGNSVGVTNSTTALEAVIFVEYVSVTKTSINRTSLRI